MSDNLDRAIQWYPGHMVRAMRKIREHLELIDVIIEVADARIAASGRNPALDDLIGARPHLLVFTRTDLADPRTTQGWMSHLAKLGQPAVAVQATAQPEVATVASALEQLAVGVRGRKRAIVVGLPNSGKSAIINGLIRRSAAKTEDRAGVTRTLQWFRLGRNLELMDTPGVLVPKIATPEAQWMLAAVGAVPKDRYDPEEVTDRLYMWLREHRTDLKVPNLEAFAALRGILRRGGEADIHNAARSYLSHFGSAGFGRISFEAVQPTAGAPDGR
ncbi:MAG: ribosome biogenesis GTPase YlqF [Vulcanimicrobiaceae bacterium]